MAFKQLVFSGVQPTGNLHLGNYLGAIKRFVELQFRYDCIYCVVDLHAITTWQDPKDLPNAIREVTAAFIASGIDPDRNIIFNQSQVAEHAELAWVFNCVARLGWLNRMTQFKEKAGKDRENASVGLYAYPTLMAADILVYRATHVPVGEDQKQHLELARDIAKKFNNDFSSSIRENGYGDEFFPLPEPLITGEATRVMSLREGVKKMSKSDASDQSRINLTDDADTIAQKIRRAKTDPEPLPSEEEGLKNRPEANNLVGIFAALADTSRTKVLQEFGNAQFSNFKSALTALAISKLEPIAREMKQLMREPDHIDTILANGASRAQVLAGQTMDAVKDILGFVRRKNYVPGYYGPKQVDVFQEEKLFARRQAEAAIQHFFKNEWDTASTLAIVAEETLSPDNTEVSRLLRNLISHDQRNYVPFFNWLNHQIPKTVANYSLVLRLKNITASETYNIKFREQTLRLQSAIIIQIVISRFAERYQEKPGLFEDFLRLELSNENPT